jgi:hypothetical protein
MKHHLDDGVERGLIWGLKELVERIGCHRAARVIARSTRYAKEEGALAGGREHQFASSQEVNFDHVSCKPS